jgi:hypothetical protein
VSAQDASSCPSEKCQLIHHFVLVFLLTQLSSRYFLPWSVCMPEGSTCSPPCSSCSSHHPL